MAEGNNQKLKLMYLMKILLDQTDETHSITMPEIISALKTHGISAERKSIYSDIENLRLYGLDIIGEQKEKTYYYHIGSRQFELAELKLLVDTVQAAKFITAKKSNSLIEKIEGMASRYEAALLQRQVYVTERIKTMNENIFYNVDILHSAIGDNRQIQFQYFNWDVEKKMVLRRDGAFYQVSPWAMSWDDENYYLIVFDSAADKIKHFRVDKMLKLAVINEPRQGRREFMNFNTAVYGRKLFGMYSGEEMNVKIRCENSFAGVMIDRFGQDISLIPVDSGYFEVNVNVAVSRQFLAWVLALGEGVKIVGCKEAVKLVEEEIARLARQYHLKQSEFELETLLKCIPSGVLKYSADEKGEFAYINKNFYQDLGYTEEQFKKKFHNSFHEMVWHEDREKAENEIIIQEGEGGIGKFDYRVEAADGKLHWFHDEGIKTTDQNGKEWYYVTLVDITKNRETEENLRILEEEYRLAAQHSGRTIGRYNVQNRTLTITAEAAKRLLLPECIEDVPYGQVKREKVSSDTAGAYVKFYQDIIDGKPEGTLMFQKKEKEGWRWISAHSTTIYSRENAPVAGLISFIDVTDQYDKDVIYTRWQQSLANRPVNSYSLFQCDLTQNNFFESSEGSLIPLPKDKGKKMTFDECTIYYAEHYVFPEDRKKFIDSLMQKQLKEDFQCGKKRITLEYREMTEENQYRWIKRSIDLVERPDAQGIIVYLMFENIDQKKRDELDARTKAETDALTGLLNRRAFEERLSQEISRQKEGSRIAFFILDMDGFKQVNDTLGHAAGDQVLIELARTIRSVLRDNDLIGRLGGDEFIFCMLNVPDNNAIRKKARSIWKLTQKKTTESISISSSMGIAVCPEDGSNFDELYHKADKALYSIKKSGKNNYGFYRA